MGEGRPIPPPKTVARQLVRFYERNGYARTQNEDRIKKEGWDRYKKGEEVRLIAYSRDELAVIRDLLHRAGFRLANPFDKGARMCQPIYGKTAVARFLEMVAEHSDD